MSMSNPFGTSVSGNVFGTHTSDNTGAGYRFKKATRTVSISDEEAVIAAIQAAKEATDVGVHFFLEFTP